MATHKVPQDVETEDKLIGFLSLKQFIFVVVGLGFGYLMFFFATKINVLVSLIWLPFTVVPLVLGLYQRKDQPVEVYLASAIRFHLKPRTRKWDQEGYEERVIVTAPPKIEHNYTKSFSGEEAVSRLTGLSHMMDSRGWASRLSGDWQNPQLAVAAASENRLVQPGQVAQADAYLQNYMQPADIMDEQTSVVARDFQSKIDQTDDSTRAHAMKALEEARAPHVEKYPQMKQTVIQPSEPLKQVRPEPVMPVEEPAIVEPTPTIEPEAPTPIIEAVLPEPIKTDDGSVEISLH
ncbi:PrgI family protein [Candidatus Saccharibacteria bacterium]|nr:PrgI family protein [Candidatus Saccharibacteria bacterium]